MADLIGCHLAAGPIRTFGYAPHFGHLAVPDWVI
jgi:hypothetical protein